MINVFLIVFFIFGLKAEATVQGFSCPEEFVGKVEKIIEQPETARAFATYSVSFSNQETLRGEVAPFITIDILKNGPFSISVGKEYRVQIRKGKLCWIEHI